MALCEQHTDWLITSVLIPSLYACLPNIVFSAKSRLIDWNSVLTGGSLHRNTQLNLSCSRKRWKFMLHIQQSHGRLIILGWNMNIGGHQNRCKPIIIFEFLFAVFAQKFEPDSQLAKNLENMRFRSRKTFSFDKQQV